MRPPHVRGRSGRTYFQWCDGRLFGFRPSGAAKAIPDVLARRPRQLHEVGEPMKLRALTAASTGKKLDEALTEANAVSWRTPYQSSHTLRQRINSRETQFLDMHLSHVPQMVELGFLAHLNVAVVEAIDVTEDGRVYLSTAAVP